MLKQSLKDRWTAALRSGDYQQGRNRLVSPDCSGNGKDRYCCLGVLAQLHAPQKRDEWGDRSFYGNQFDDQLISTNDMRILSGMNDGTGIVNGEVRVAPSHDFHQIADWIDENVRAEEG